MYFLPFIFMQNYAENTHISEKLHMTFFQNLFLKNRFYSGKNLYLQYFNCTKTTETFLNIRNFRKIRVINEHETCTIFVSDFTLSNCKL